MSAIGMSAPRGKRFVMSAYADYRHDHMVFARQQSLAMRDMDWEGRVEPMLPWSALIVRGVGVAVLSAASLAMLM
jgi:hypothetical protein